MKKIVFLCIAVLAIAGCSNDDDGTIKPTYESIAGVWYPSKYIKADGTKVNHIGRCSTKRDYLEILNYRKVRSFYYYESCESTYLGLGCSSYLIDSKTDKIFNCSSFLTGKLTVTKNTLRIDFDKPSTDGDAQIVDAISVIFTKQ